MEVKTNSQAVVFDQCLDSFHGKRQELYAKAAERLLGEATGTVEAVQPKRLKGGRKSVKVLNTPSQI